MNQINHGIGIAKEDRQMLTGLADTILRLVAEVRRLRVENDALRGVIRSPWDLREAERKIEDSDGT